MRKQILLLFALVAFSYYIPVFQSKGYVSMELPDDLPVVYIEPSDITAHVGENFSIAVKVFNLRNKFRTAFTLWEPGEPLGPTGGIFNYSLGSLFGLDIKLEWNPSVIRYMNHTVMIPVEANPEGILHEPLVGSRIEEIDTDAGTYTIVESSRHPAEAFNQANGSAAIFNMTFTVLKHGFSDLKIANSDLAIPYAYSKYAEARAEIPHWRLHGSFHTPRSVIPEFSIQFISLLFIITTLSAAIIHLRKRTLR